MNELRYWLFFILLSVTGLFAALWLRGGTDAMPFALLESLAAGIGNLIPQYERGGHSTSDTPDASVPTARQSGIDIPPSESRHYSKLSSVDHTAGDRQACARPQTKARNETEAQLIYKWVDENGQTHMSDTHPVGRIASVMDIGLAKRDFTYQILPEGVALPIEFPGQVAAGSKRIYDTWHYFLGEHKLRQSQIQLLLVGDLARFDAYYAQVSSDSRPVSGFYSIGRNQAVVKFDPVNKARALEVTFHEVSHLITASHLGPTPPWLTEGLAEHFETMQVKDQAGIIHPNRLHLKTLKTIPLPRLRQYLSMDRGEWYGAERGRNYAIAWSLLHFLLEGSPGLPALKSVIQQAEAKFCQPFSAVGALDQAYPGGIDRLEQDWRKWLTNDRFRIQQT